MPDDKTKKGAPDRQVASGEDYEVQYLARQHGISIEQARELIAKYGNDRATLDEAATNLRKREKRTALQGGRGSGPVPS
jgi:hypothetical protein